MKATRKQRFLLRVDDFFPPQSGFYHRLRSTLFWLRWASRFSGTPGLWTGTSCQTEPSAGRIHLLSRSARFRYLASASFCPLDGALWLQTVNVVWWFFFLAPPGGAVGHLLRPAALRPRPRPGARPVVQSGSAERIEETGEPQSSFRS